MGDKVTIQIKIGLESVKALEHMAVDARTTRNEIMERVLRAGLEVLKEGGTPKENS